MHVVLDPRYQYHIIYATFDLKIIYHFHRRDRLSLVFSITNLALVQLIY